ncbi:small ribosomal subunit protein mS26 [Planococcus citri]|uniref:small ribosomal subunit protein mS26 n=1 Tax=Planococcus citri TaxID=170843 RepID=UPI0031F82715
MSVLIHSLKQCNIQYLPSLYHLSVRWKTKPRWVPIGKTKVFRVPQPKPIPPDEAEEMKRLTKVFHTRMKSIKHLFREAYRANATSEEVIQKFEQDKEDHWQKCMELNDRWNQQIAIERAQRDAEFMEQEIQAAHEFKRKEDEADRKRLEALEEVVRLEKEASAHFVTEENIDEAIERVLNSPPHSFSFAIDRDGRKYSGFSKTPDIDAEIESLSEDSSKVSSSVNE